MTRQDGRNLPLAALNERRRRAVALRLDGMRLAEVAAKTELSAPTIIAAHKAFLAGGWEAVNVAPRGRRAGSGQALNADNTQTLILSIAEGTPERLGLPYILWEKDAVSELASKRLGIDLPATTLGRYLQEFGFFASGEGGTTGADTCRIQEIPLASLLPNAWQDLGKSRILLRAIGPRRKARWLVVPSPLSAKSLIDFFDRLQRAVGRKLRILGGNLDLQRAPEVRRWLDDASERIHFQPQAPTAANAKPRPKKKVKHFVDLSQQPPAKPDSQERILMPAASGATLTHLQRLEAESIHILREVVAEADNPVMLYSIGKDSAVMLHLAMKAFYPGKPPFPLLHVDTTWKFREMYEFRDRTARELGLDLLVHVNPEGLAMKIDPFTHGSAIHTDIMKTQGLKQALDKYGFDAAFGGARRDEEKSRAKERIFSFRSTQHRWDPKNQRPELWHLYNARKHKGESMRVFPLSNWTELDIWQYIYLENIPIVPLYYAKPRPMVERDGALIMVDDERMPLRPGEVPMMRTVRFRTLGCYPLTGAVASNADTLPAIIQEMLLTRTSERQGRVIDHDQAASMEKKKQEGYF
jgi:sulfate adenylyltransferase subunit 2